MSKKLLVVITCLFAVIIAIAYPQKTYAQDRINTEEETIDYEIIYDADGNVAARLYPNGLFVPASKSVQKNYQSEKEVPWHSVANKIKIISISAIVDGTFPSIIGSYAFADCKNVTEIYMPPSVSNIKSFAFLNCSSLKKIGCGESLSSISDAAFMSCSALEEVFLPNKYFIIGNDNFSYTDVPVMLISYPGGIAEKYAANSDGEVTFRNVNSYLGNGYMYGATKDNVIKLSGNDEILKWDYDPYSKELWIGSNDTTKKCYVTFNETWSNLKNIVLSIRFDDKVAGIGENCFEDYSNLQSISASVYMQLIEEKAFNGCHRLSYLTFECADMFTYSYDFFDNLPQGANIYCHYSEEPSSTYATFVKNGYNVESFEGTERLLTINDNLSCSNQFEGIKDLSKKSYKIDENGERVKYTQTWDHTACVVTSTAMLIERRAYLDGYKATVGDYNQKTVAAIVKEISYDYELVNGNWLFVWGEHTTSYDTLEKDGEPYEITTNSLSGKEISKDNLISYLADHPEGVVSYNNKHAVLVINYIDEGKNEGKFTVWDPATGKEHIRPYKNLSGSGPSTIKKFVYAEH